MKGLDRKYLRAFLQKVGPVEVGISPIDLSDTREGHLRELHERYIEPDSLTERETLEKEKEEQAIAKTRGKRERRLPKRFTDTI